MRREPSKTPPAQVGMMFGLWIGAGVGTVLFAITMNPLWFVLAGAGLALGLGIGAAGERWRQQR